MSARTRARSADGRVLDVRDMTTEELEWSDYGRSKFGAIHFVLGAYLCGIAVGVLYIVRVGGLG